MTKPWFSEGLRFKCTGCGKCCTGTPGFAWVSVDEIIAIADYLKCSVEDFARKYLRKVDGRFALLEDQTNFDCVFLRDKKCTIYEVRPKQCKTYPWWQKNLSSKEEWQKAAAFCEGIDHADAPTIPCETILDEA